jgi:hypothetical protein
MWLKSKFQLSWSCFLLYVGPILLRLVDSKQFHRLYSLYTFMLFNEYATSFNTFYQYFPFRRSVNSVNIGIKMRFNRSNICLRWTCHYQYILDIIFFNKIVKFPWSKRSIRIHSIAVTETIYRWHEITGRDSTLLFSINEKNWMRERERGSVCVLLLTEPRAPFTIIIKCISQWSIEKLSRWIVE